MFEGSEKKIEIIFSKQAKSLRLQPQKFWNDVVKACGARIVSRKEFPLVTSFLLSESSLFLWDYRLVMITCGKTNLSSAFFKILKGVSRDHIELLFFQRKNEFFPKQQASAFSEDVKKIQKKTPGESLQFGFLHEHHFFLFHSDSSFQPESDDHTLEVLMYDSLNIKRLSKQTMRELKTRLLETFPGFEIQDHVFFDPSGYSANAVRGVEYYTIHITPHASFFYISFETNMKTPGIEQIVSKVRQVFGSETFDVISFTPTGFKEPPQINGPELSCNTFFHHVLKCGYQVVYKCFSENKITSKPASTLKA